MEDIINSWNLDEERAEVTKLREELSYQAELVITGKLHRFDIKVPFEYERELLSIIDNQRPHDFDEVLSEISNSLQGGVYGHFPGSKQNVSVGYESLGKVVHRLLEAQATIEGYCTQIKTELTLVTEFMELKKNSWLPQIIEQYTEGILEYSGSIQFCTRYSLELDRRQENLPLIAREMNKENAIKSLNEILNLPVTPNSIQSLNDQLGRVLKQYLYEFRTIPDPHRIRSWTYK